MTSKNLAGWIARDQGEDCMIIYKQEICSFGCTPYNISQPSGHIWWGLLDLAITHPETFWNNIETITPCPLMVDTLEVSGSILKYLEVIWSDESRWCKILRGMLAFSAWSLTNPPRKLKFQGWLRKLEKEKEGKTKTAEQAHQKIEGNIQ